jgi:ribokinase
MNYDIITLGGATEDISFYTQEGVLIKNKKDILRQRLLGFEFGAKLKVDKTVTNYGGGAANAAVSLRRMGFKTSCIICVGDDDRGARIIKNLVHEGIDTELVQITRKRETGFSFILVGPENEHIVFSNRAANEDLVISRKDLVRLKNAKWIYIASLSGDWRKNLDKIFSLAGPKVVWNPGHIQLDAGYKGLKRYLKKIEILIMNKDEAMGLVITDEANGHKKKDHYNHTLNLLKIMHSWGPRIVVVTEGSHGSHAYDGKKVFFQKICPVKKVMNTTGIGDAFGSTLITGMEFFNGDLKKAMNLSARNSSAVVSKFGAQTGLLRFKNLKIKRFKESKQLYSN